MVTTEQMNTRWDLNRQSSDPPCIHIALALLSPKAWSTQFKMRSKEWSHAGISEDRKNFPLLFGFREETALTTEHWNKQPVLLVTHLVPAQWGAPPQMLSQPLDCLLSRNELGDGISAAPRCAVRKVLSEMAAANPEQAGMGYNGKENKLKINIKYTITNHKQPALLLSTLSLTVHPSPSYS